MVSYGMELALQKMAPIGNPYDIEPAGVEPLERQTSADLRPDPSDK